MPPARRTSRFLAAVFGRAPVEEQIRAELDFHVEMLARDLTERGLSREAALAEARARFGDLEEVRAACRDAAADRDRALRRIAFLDDVLQDVRQALRQLRRAPGFTAASVLTLALGIGATTTIFGAVDSVVLRPFAWGSPDRVVGLFERWHDRDGNVSVGNYVDWRDGSHSFAALAAEQFSPINLSEAGAPERVNGGRVTQDFFRVFGVRPLLGRVFGPQDDEPGQDRVAVLSYGLWMRRFAGDRGVINGVVRLNDLPMTIIGVMPSRFDPSASGEALWLPLVFTPAQRAQHDEHYLFVAGLLAPGTTVAATQRELDPIAERLAARYPRDDADRGVRVARLSDTILGDQRGRLLTVLGAVSFVLLIACGNVANLLLARGAARSGEFAVRTALGARPGRLVRQLLTESVVLAMLAAAVGLALTWFGIKLVVAGAPAGAFPRLEDAHVDGAVLAFALLVSIACAAVFGLAPALRAARSDIQTMLRAGGRSGGPGRDLLRGALIVTEVALALALLDGAGLLVRSAIYLDRTSVGFDAEGVLSARIALSPTAYADPERVAQTFVRIAQAVRGAPGVEAAGIVSQAPMGDGGSSNGLVPEGRPLDIKNAIDARIRIISPGYLGVMRIPLLTGRAFTDQDIAGGPRVMIVSQALAERAWPGEDPIGKRVSCCEGAPDDPRWKTVVGVAGNVRSDGPRVEPVPEFYLPIAQAPAEAWTWNQRTMALVARSASADPVALTPAVREAVHSVDPEVPLFEIRTMREAIRAATAEHRFNTVLLLALAVIGVLLAGAGIASVMAFFVGARTREIGVRMAMGATGAGIVALLVRRNLRPLAMGLGLGLVAAAATTQFLRGSLYGVAAVDPVTALVVVVALAAVALVATLIPARRAMRVDPVSVLQG